MDRYDEYAKICQLKSEDKFTRIKALEEILRCVDSMEDLDENNCALQWETYHRPIVRAMYDPMESCRDLSVEILKRFIRQLPCSDKNIVYVIPIIAKRLGPQELIESSEEVRYKYLTLLRIIVDKYDDKLVPYFEDLITILTRTVTDKYPKVKQESCDIICALAKAVPHDFHKRSSVFVKPVLSNMAHQHHKVRSTTVRTIGEILIYGDSKLMDTVATPMAERLFDQSGSVRIAVIEVAGKWMTEMRDRYSWWHKTLPLLLTGFNDVLSEVRLLANKLWIAVGEQYIKENDTDKKFKEKLDFLPEYLDYYPKNIVRPNLGCRTIAQQNFCKLVHGITRELSDWIADIKVRAAQLLCILVLNVEEEMFNYIGKLLPAMYRACHDEDKRVVENVELAAEYMAYFIPANNFFNSMESVMKSGTTTGHLKIISAVCRGSKKSELSHELTRLGKFLRDKKVCQNTRVSFQLSVLDCCRALLNNCKEDCSVVAEDLFATLFNQLAVGSEPVVKENANELLEFLSKTEDLESIERLYDKHIRMILESIQDDVESWHSESPNFKLYQACVNEARHASYKHLDLISPILKTTTSPDSEPRLRLKQYILLSEYFEHWDNPLDSDAFLDFANNALENVILPGLRWTAGRSSEATRTASMCCLCGLLNRMKVNAEHPLYKISLGRFGWLYEELCPVLVSLVTDDSQKTRLYALRAMCLVINIGQELGYVEEQHVHKISPEILSRLEDQNEEVRLAALEATREVWKKLPDDYDLGFYYVHIEYAYDKLLVHLDDPVDKIQKQTFDCLMHLMKVHPEMLIKKIEKLRSKFINKKALNELTEASKEYLKNKSDESKTP